MLWPGFDWSVEILGLAGLIVVIFPESRIAPLAPTYRGQRGSNATLSASAAAA